MKVMDYSEYTNVKKAFLQAHDNDWRVETSPMDSYGVYHKEYICSDGAIFYEVMSPVYEQVTVEVHKCTVTVEVKFLRTEFWSSDNSQSSYYYEKF